MKPMVEKAVDEIRTTFKGHQVDASADSDGGAFVKVHDVDVGEKLSPTQVTVAFRITFQHPHADVYPHFLIGKVKRQNGQQLGQGFHDRQWEGHDEKLDATMVSRRSNRRDPAVDTPALKLLRVIEWIRKQ